MEEFITDNDIRGKFEQVIAKIPVFLQDVARNKVLQRIKSLLAQENRSQVIEKDIVDAFFKETPFGFHGPLKTDMLSIGLDYRKYGYD